MYLQIRLSTGAHRFAATAISLIFRSAAARLRNKKVRRGGRAKENIYSGAQIQWKPLAIKPARPKATAMIAPKVSLKFDHAASRRPRRSTLISLVSR